MRYEGIHMASLPLTEVWFGWGVVLLVVLFGLISTSSPGFIPEKFKLMFAEQDRRTFSSMSRQTGSSTLIYSILFTLLSLTIALYICLPAPSGIFSLGRYGLFSLGLVLVLLLRALVLWILSFIFGTHDTFSQLISQYSRILFTTAVCTGCLLFAYILLPRGLIHRGWIMLPSAFFYSSILLWHLRRLLPQTAFTYLYGAIYLLMVEVLPMIILVNNYNRLMI